LLSLDRPQEAARAFEAARGSASTTVDAAYGQALANLRSKRTDEAIGAASGAGLSPSRRDEIGLAALAQRAAANFDAGQYRETLRALNQRRLFAPEPRDLSILRAWSMYHNGYREDARTLFSMLDKQLSTSESRAGIAATNQQMRE
jgi:hypothetical protein